MRAISSALSAKIYMRPPATTGETKTGVSKIDLGCHLARPRIGADQKPVPRHQPQLAAGEHRPAPSRAAGKLGHPPHLAVGAGERNELAAEVHDIDGVAGDPRHLRAGEISRPQPLARGFRRGDHFAAVADRVHHAVVDHRPRRIAEDAGGRGFARARQGIAPGRLAAAGVKSGNVAGRKGRNDDVAVDRRTHIAEKRSRLRQAARRPQLLAVCVAERIEDVVGRDEIDLAARGRRRAPDGLADPLRPQNGAVAGIDADDGAKAGRRIDDGRRPERALPRSLPCSSHCRGSRSSPRAWRRSPRRTPTPCRPHRE